VRITFVLPGHGKTPVGGYKVVYEYANCLARRDHKVTVVHAALLDKYTAPLDYPKKVARFVQRSLDKSYQPKTWFSIDPRVMLLWRPSLNAKFIPDSDVVIATAWQTAEWVQDYPGKKGEKFYLIQHWENWGHNDVSRLEQTWRAPLHKIVIARWLKDIADSMGEESDYIPNGLDFDSFGIDHDIKLRNPYHIMMLYHPLSWKGSRYGVEAVISLKNEFPCLVGTLFGTTRRPTLPPWIEYYRLPSPLLLRKLYNRAAIFLAPSLSEGWGLPACEAMMCGTAVVATDIGGHREFLEHGHNGLFVPPADSSGLAAAVRTLIADQRLRSDLARAGYESIKKFTWRRACDSFELVLRKYTNA